MKDKHRNKLVGLFIGLCALGWVVLTWARRVVDVHIPLWVSLLLLVLVVGGLVMMLRSMRRR